METKFGKPQGRVRNSDDTDFYQLNFITSIGLETKTPPLYGITREREENADNQNWFIEPHSLIHQRINAILIICQECRFYDNLSRPTSVIAKTVTCFDFEKWVRKSRRTGLQFGIFRDSKVIIMCMWGPSLLIRLLFMLISSPGVLIC